MKCPHASCLRGKLFAVYEHTHSGPGVYVGKDMEEAEGVPSQVGCGDDTPSAYAPTPDLRGELSQNVHHRTGAGERIWPGFCRPSGGVKSYPVCRIREIESRRL